VLWVTEDVSDCLSNTTVSRSESLWRMLWITEYVSEYSFYLSKYWFDWVTKNVSDDSSSIVKNESIKMA